MESTLLLIFLLTISVVNGDYYSDVAKFCSMNGLNYITISSLPYLRTEIQQLSSELQKQNLMLRQLEFDQIEENYERYQDSLVLLLKSELLEDEEGLQPYLSLITISKVKRGLFVFTTPLRDKHKQMLTRVANQIVDNSLVYVIYQEPGSLKTKHMQIITVKNADKGVVNPVRLNSLGQVIEEYDLQGLQVLGVTLSWAPFLTIDCNEEGKNCTTRGFYHDFTNAMGRIMNFTWDSHADPNGDWGVRPISGPFNRSGEWGGVMGGVVNGDYMISLCQWVWLRERYGLLDFVSTTAEATMLAITPKPPEVDTGLFVRPFTNDAWTGKCSHNELCNSDSIHNLSARMFCHVYNHFGNLDDTLHIDFIL